MFRILALCLIALPGLASAQACGTRDLIAELGPADRADLDALVAGHAYATGTLFRAEKDGRTVTVVGTIHLPDPRLAPIVARLEDSVRTAEVVVIEASVEDEAGLQALAMQKPGMFFLTEGPTLIDILSESEWAAVKERLSAIGVPGFFAAKFQPWYLSMTLALPACALRVMQSGPRGLDRQLEEIARDAGVAVATLDDPEALLRLFADEPIERQLDGLRVALGMQSEGDASTSTLVEAYFDGRIRESWEYARILVGKSGIANGAELFEEVNRELLVNRNVGWEPRIVDLVAGKNAVVAVGAAHLSGESGVLRSLERAGYRVSPL